VKPRRIDYTAEELAWIEANTALPIKECHRQFCEKFGRADLSANNIHGLKKRKKWLTGRKGSEGMVPHNKGKPCPSSRHPNCARNHFKKGERADNANPIGHERLKDGYVHVKAREGKYQYEPKHRLLWEKEHGPLADGMMLKCLDGNKLNTHPSNWEAVPVGMIIRLNGGRTKRHLAFDAAPPELKPALLAVAKIAHRSRQILAETPHD
jgi:hypothetical protein